MKDQTNGAQLRMDLYREAARVLTNAKWHWFSYHFQFFPPHPFARSLIEACADCEERLPNLGWQLLRELCSIGGREKHKPDYVNGGAILVRRAEQTSLAEETRGPVRAGPRVAAVQAGR